LNVSRTRNKLNNNEELKRLGKVRGEGEREEEMRRK